MNDVLGSVIRTIQDENYRNLMHIVCSYTSGYFSIYDDEYEHVHYDDNDYYHVLHDI